MSKGRVPYEVSPPGGYELWDMRSRSKVADFTTEAEAMAGLREMVQQYGNEAAEHFVLFVINLDESFSVIARGEQIASDP